MSNTDDAISLMYLQRTAASLDERVRDVLGPFHFSDSPQMWSGQLDGLSSEIYCSMVRRTKEAVRAVAQEFRGMDWTRCLLDGAHDSVRRVDMLRSMLEAVDILALPGASAVGTEPDQLCRLHNHIPTLRDAVSSLIARVSRWQDEFGGSHDVFSVLELPAETLESLLVLISASIPDAPIARGRILMQRLMALWNERRLIIERSVDNGGHQAEIHRLIEQLDDQREIQDSIVESITALLEQLDGPPSSPIPFLGQEFIVRQLLGASQAFSRLRLQQISIGRDISRLERILDRFMDIMEGVALA